MGVALISFAAAGLGVISASQQAKTAELEKERALIEAEAVLAAQAEHQANVRLIIMYALVAVTLMYMVAVVSRRRR